MKEIELTKGKIALVDDADFEWLNQWSWGATRARTGRTHYAQRTVFVNERPKTVIMHRLIMNAEKGTEVDHIDRNGLNNQRLNLRLATRSQNMANQRKQEGSSIFKGVTWTDKGRCWVSRIRYLGHLYTLGRFKLEIDAARAYDGKARELFGEHCAVNFPLEGEQSCHREAT